MSSHVLSTRGPRLAPLPPRGLLSRLLAWWFKHRFGKVMMPLRVIFPRFRAMVLPHMAMMRLTQGVLELEPLLCHLVQAHASRLNGCTFCEDAHVAMAMDAGLPTSKFDLLHDLDDAAFTGPERCALRYIQEATRGGRVRDATFSKLQAHFSESQIVQLTWLNAVVNYTNLLALPLGLSSDGFCDLVAARPGYRGQPPALAPEETDVVQQPAGP